MKVIIVGGVAGGASAAARLRRLDEQAEIVLLERGPYISFANCGLPYYIKSADAEVSMEDTIELWLSYFRDAAFVITDSFHGTAFSINFNKDFYVFKNAQRGSSRFDSLLGQLGLQDRIIKEKIVADTEIRIDWDKVNQLKTMAVTVSIEWLTKKLS